MAFAIDGLQQRGIFFINPGEDCYEGMIVAEHCLDNDLVVNLQKSKQLTNVRASGSDENVILTPPTEMTLEACVAYINEDELVEVTPLNIRLRKNAFTQSS